MKRAKKNLQDLTEVNQMIVCRNVSDKNLALLGLQNGDIHCRLLKCKNLKLTAS